MRKHLYYRALSVPNICKTYENFQQRATSAVLFDIILIFIIILVFVSLPVNANKIFFGFVVGRLLKKEQHRCNNIYTPSFPVFVDIFPGHLSFIKVFQRVFFHYFLFLLFPSFFMKSSFKFYPVFQFGQKSPPPLVGGNGQNIYPCILDNSNNFFF